MRFLLISLFFILLIDNTNAQKTTFEVFKGRVIDKDSKTPLPFAHIRYVNSLSGTTTNNEGIFSLLFKNKNPEIEISFIGYQNKRIKLFHSDKTTDIYLDPSSLILSEIKVSSLRPVEYITNAIDSLLSKKNIYPIRYDAFYREIIQENSNLNQYAEGVIKLSRTEKEDRIFLKKGRSAKDLSQYEISKLTTISLGGPQKLIDDDPLLVPPQFLQKEHLDKYSFTIGNHSVFNNKPVVEIIFKGKSKENKKFTSGIITIEENTFSIIKISYTVEADPVTNFLMKLFKMEYNGDHNQITTTYHNIDGIWHLKSIQKEIKLYMKKKKKGVWRDFNFNISKELIVTKTQHNSSQLLESHSLLKKNKEFGKQVGLYDEHFWDNYVILNPTNFQDSLFLNSYK